MCQESRRNGTRFVKFVMLNERFEILRELGSGAQGVTFLAMDHNKNIEVAVKKLAVENIENWKCLELFERESKVLRNLNHKNIPSYINSFHVDDHIGRHFYLVQSYVPGKNLEKRFNNGERWNEERATKLIESLLDILEYLYGLSPSVIHRDIKPSNIIETDDGEIFLIDFGSVQEKIQSAVGGSTISGTAGYIPMEQLMGRSVPASDIYALGVTIIRLMSRTHPIDIELKNAALAFKEIVSCSTAFKNVLEMMTAPILENRVENTTKLREFLQALSLSKKENVTSVRRQTSEQRAPETNVKIPVSWLKKLQFFYSKTDHFLFWLALAVFVFTILIILEDAKEQTITAEAHPIVEDTNETLH